MARKTNRRQFIGGLLGATVALTPLPAEANSSPKLPCGLKELPKQPSCIQLYRTLENRHSNLLLVYID
jgi:hypothetical protein